MSFSLFGTLRKKASKAVDAFKRKIHVPMFEEEEVAPDRKTQLEEQVAAAQLMDATAQTEGWKLIQAEQVRSLNAAMSSLMECDPTSPAKIAQFQAECMVLRREINRVPQAMVLAEQNAAELAEIKKDEEEQGEEDNG